MTLTRKQIVFLRGKAHPLSPVVSVGNAGLSDAIMAEIEIALDHHELIKIKLGVDDRDLRKKMCNEISNRSKSAVVQQIGKVAVFYRTSEKSRITLP